MPGAVRSTAKTPNSRKSSGKTPKRSDAEESRQLPKDFDKIFDKRLKNFHFTSIPPKLEEWKGTNISNDVFDREMCVRNFKSSEERMIYRMELWIDVCRIETIQNGVLTNGAGKFHSAKRFRKPGGSEKSIMKGRSFSIGKSSSPSLESIDKPIEFERKPRPKSNEFVLAVETPAAARLAHAKSTNNILHERADRDIEQTLDRYGTNPKRKLKFFLFRKKDKDSSEPRRLSFGKKSKNTRKGKQLEEHENNNIGLSSQTRIRPSVFDMEPLKGSIPDLQRQQKYDYEYDPTKRKTSGIRAETISGYHTISTPSSYRKPHDDDGNQQQQRQQQQEVTLFHSRNHNDSVKRQKIKYRGVSSSETNLFNGHDVFFDGRGTVRTEIGNI